MTATNPLKTAFFSALLVLAVAYPILGLKLTTVGIKLEVHALDHCWRGSADVCLAIAAQPAG